MSHPERQEQPYQLERRTAVVLVLGMVGLIVVGIAVPALLGGSPCQDVAGLVGNPDPQLTRHTVGERPDRGLRAFEAGEGALLTRVVAAPSTQVDALQRVDAQGRPVGDCVDLAVITEEPAFLLAVDGRGMLLLRADDEERRVELRAPTGEVRWQAMLDVPAGAPGAIAVETAGRLTSDTVALVLPVDAEPRRLAFDRETGETVTPAVDG